MTSNELALHWDDLRKAASSVAARAPRSQEREDVVQEVALRALKYAPRYDAAKGSVGTWLKRIARSTVSDLHKYERRSKRRLGEGTTVQLGEEAGDYASTIPLDYRETGPLDALVQKETSRRVRSCVNRLPADLRRAIREGTKSKPLMARAMAELATRIKKLMTAE